MRRSIWVFVGRTSKKVRFLTLRLNFFVILIIDVNVIQVHEDCVSNNCPSPTPRRASLVKNATLTLVIQGPDKWRRKLIKWHVYSSLEHLSRPWENVPWTCATNEDSNQYVHPCCLIRASLSAWRNFASLAIQYTYNDDSNQSARRYSYVRGMFSHVAVIIIILFYYYYYFFWSYAFFFLPSKLCLTHMYCIRNFASLAIQYTYNDDSNQSARRYSYVRRYVFSRCGYYHYFILLLLLFFLKLCIFFLPSKLCLTHMYCISLSRDRTSVGHGDDGLDAITSNQRINITLCKIKTSMYLKSSKKKKKKKKKTTIKSSNFHVPISIFRSFDNP